MMDHVADRFRRPSPGVTALTENTIIQGALKNGPVTDITSIEDFRKVWDALGFEFAVDTDFGLFRARSPRILKPEEFGLVFLQLRTLPGAVSLR